uniref:Oxysterol-binding protein n=1 Tax=Oreochromis niloticus TaxID=8128 RepID=A0A669DL79_ORENI
MEDCTLEDQLLLHAKEGNCPQVQRLLQSRIHQNSSLNINCRSRSKTCSGCTPLHLACSFGHRDVVEELLKVRAVYESHHYHAFLTHNIFSHLPLKLLNVTEDDEIITMLEAAERREARRHEEKLLEAAREGDISTLSKLLNGKDAPDIHCRDSVGNTPLHCAAYRGQKQCVIKLLKCGANPSIKNNNAQTALDLVCTDELKQILAAYKNKVILLHGSSRFLGWHTFIIISDFLLFQVKPWDHCFFTLRCFDDSVHYFKVPSQTNRWLDAFEEHASYCTRHDTEECLSCLKLLQAARAFQQKLESEVSIFLSMSNVFSAIKYLVSISGHALCGRLTFCLVVLCLQVWSLKVEQEVEKNKALTEALQTLATENHELKQSLSKRRKSSNLSTLNEDDFYDAVSESESEHSLSGFLSVASYSCEEDEGRDTPFLNTLRRPSAYRGPSGMSGEGNHGNQPSQCNGVKHRTSLPAPMFSRNDVSIWSILKKCIGMELSKIAMPVVFNEPLSFLQRLTEYMEHTYLIHQANATTDSVERMKCVAAFAVSAVASQWERTGKPFNPLLGETYELIRDDLGFRWMSEQVSHHPPVSAFHAEGLKEDFVFHGSIYPKLKFWGKSIEAEPKGVITLELPKYNEAYTWTNPTCCVHNIIVGQLWIEQYGSVEVLNHKTGERCSMTFKPCGLFGKELHKVEGYILDKSKKKLCAIYGKWTECLYTVDPATFDAHKKTEKKNPDEKKGNKQTSVDEEPEETPPPDTETVQVIPGSELVWKITPRPENSSKFYAFSTFAMQLNELDKRMEGVMPPTDSRLRPDIRAMERGDIDLASAEKKRLEEKQRMARKNRTKSTEEWKVRWFQQGPNPHNKAQDWLYLKGYWDRNYSQLPDIY